MAAAVNGGRSDTLRDSRFTRLLGVPLAIQQAGMGAVSTPALAAAVAKAGALGMIGAAGIDARNLHDQLTLAKHDAGEGTRIGVNFLMPFLDIAALEVAASGGALVECFYGDPDPGVVARIHDARCPAAWQVGSRDEALAAVDAGCDMLVVQGVEAGGHVRGTTPLLTLIQGVRTHVDVPLVAAGGLGSGGAITAAFAAGADAARVGTCLLATHEANVHPAYADALVRAGPDETALTEVFSMGWPHAPHRVLRSCIGASNANPLERSPVPPGRDFAGDVASAALYAGTSVGNVTGVVPAADVIARLVAETEATTP